MRPDEDDALYMLGDYGGQHQMRLTPLQKKALQRKMKRLKVTVIREDGRLERHCKHGVVHTVGHAFKDVMEKYDWVHGCCGCCNDYETQVANTHEDEKQPTPKRDLSWVGKQHDHGED